MKGEYKSHPRSWHNGMCHDLLKWCTLLKISLLVYFQLTERAKWTHESTSQHLRKKEKEKNNVREYAFLLLGIFKKFGCHTTSLRNAPDIVQGEWMNDCNVQLMEKDVLYMRCLWIVSLMLLHSFSRGWSYNGHRWQNMADYLECNEYIKFD